MNRFFGCHKSIFNGKPKQRVKVEIHFKRNGKSVQQFVIEMEVKSVDT